MASLNLIIKIRRFGTSLKYDNGTNRSIYLTNTISLLLAAMILFFAVQHVIFSSDRYLLVPLFVQLLVSISIPYVNKAGYINLSRYLLSIEILYGILTITILRKVEGVTSESTYFLARSLAVVLSSLIPIVVFKIKEKIHLILNLAISALSWVLFDPIHNWIGVGYYQTGHSAPDYYYNNFLFLISYMITFFIAWYLKSIQEKHETRNEKIISILDEKNSKILTQKEDLEEKNSLLISLLNKQEEDVALINQELIRRNYELLQFSYALSHNIRGPVASLMGLVQLVQNCSVGELNLYLQGIDKSAQKLDRTIKDLNSMLDINDDHREERIDLEKEVNDILNSYKKAINEKAIITSVDLQIKQLYSVKTFIHSILNQLISNAIRFRKDQTESYIKIESWEDGSIIKIAVRDNGAGIDLNRFNDDLFKPFKRFHSSSGKGLGLYLVKLQVDKLNGKMNVESCVERGTSFTISLHGSHS